MVVADVLCAINLAASVMVNGLCCYYQMNEENERRKENEIVIKNALRQELNVHRREEMFRKQDELIRAYNDSVSLQWQDERRKKLMTQKSVVMARSNSIHSRDQPAKCDRAKNSTMDPTEPIVTTRSPPPGNRNFSLSRDQSSELFLSGKNSLVSKRNQNVSSLFDDSLGEEENSFEEICIE